MCSVGVDRAENRISYPQEDTVRDGQCAVEAAKANAVPSFYFGGISYVRKFLRWL